MGLDLNKLHELLGELEARLDRLFTLTTNGLSEVEEHVDQLQHDFNTTITEMKKDLGQQHDDLQALKEAIE